MIWPWSTINNLRWKLTQAEQRIEALERGQLIHESFYRTYFYEIRAAHKGIRRLVEKLKRARQETAPCSLAADLHKGRLADEEVT